MFPVPGSLLLAIDINTDALIEDVLQTGGRILLVVVLAYVAVRLIKGLITPLVRVAVREQMVGESEAEVTRRIETLSGVISQTTVIVVAVIAIVTILPEFGINAGPLIAGLGLVGLAVGFGAQNIVRDVINGLEVLIENQYTRGDFIRLRSNTGGSISGNVEDINLRRTVLRDQDGAVHFVSHGSIEVASNLTRGFSRVYMTVTTAAGDDLDRVFEVINATGTALAADPDFASRIRQAPQAEGIENLTAATVEVRIEGVTEPGEQWAVSAELRRRLKLAFDEAGLTLEQ